MRRADGILLQPTPRSRVIRPASAVKRCRSELSKLTFPRLPYHILSESRYSCDSHGSCTVGRANLFASFNQVVVSHTRPNVGNGDPPVYKRDANRLLGAATASLDNFVTRGRVAWIRPVGEVARGVAIDESSFDPAGFYVWAFVMPVFVPSSHVSFNLGFRLKRFDGSQLWNANEPDCTAELAEAIATQAVSQLQSVNDAASVMSFMHRRGIVDRHTTLLCHSKLGNIEAAERAYQELMQGLDVTVKWQRELAESASDVLRKLRHSQAEAHRQLQQWSNATVKSLGVEDLF